jgi:hypothetical protein
VSIGSAQHTDGIADEIDQDLRQAPSVAAAGSQDRAIAARAGSGH